MCMAFKRATSFDRHELGNIMATGAMQNVAMSSVAIHAVLSSLSSLHRCEVTTLYSAHQPTGCRYVP
jgi:hypothetical protein